MKTCTKCGETKDFSKFNKLRISKDGFNYCCRECASKRRKELKENPILQLKRAISSSVKIENKILALEGKKLCSDCRSVFFISEIYGTYCIVCKRKNETKRRNTDDGKRKKSESGVKSYKKNKEKRQITSKIYREKNKEKLAKNKREYYEKNIDKKKEYDKIYRLNKKLNMTEEEKELQRAKNRDKMRIRRLKLKEGN